MESLSALILSGIALGLGSGVTPGPLLTLLISQTLRFGAGEGGKIALAPIITDLPIILISVLVLSRLAKVDALLGIISLCGGLFLIYLGWESMTSKGVDWVEAAVQPRSIRKGVLTNFLNPNPYMFWFTIGGPLLVKAMTFGVAGPATFIIALYGSMVGSMMAAAFLVGRSRTFLKSRYYVYTLKLIGVALWVFAAFFLRDCARYFGMI